MTRARPGVYVRQNILRRKVFDLSGQEVGDEFVVENQALMMYPPFLSDRATSPEPEPEPT
jgi:vancomycin resistance protein VanW